MPQTQNCAWHIVGAQLIFADEGREAVKGAWKEGKQDEVERESCGGAGRDEGVGAVVGEGLPEEVRFKGRQEESEGLS